MCAYVSSQFLPFKHVQLSGHLAVPSGLILRMARQFLETLWPMFGFARFLGMFPCKRLRTEDGKIELKPINWKIQWALFACFNVLVLGLIIASYAWISFKAEIPMADVTQCQNKIRGKHRLQNKFDTFNMSSQKQTKKRKVHPIINFLKSCIQTKIPTNLFADDSKSEIS
mgnify:CR=1 FL=1